MSGPLLSMVPTRQKCLTNMDGKIGVSLGSGPDGTSGRKKEATAECCDGKRGATEYLLALVERADDVGGIGGSLPMAASALLAARHTSINMFHCMSKHHCTQSSKFVPHIIVTTSALYNWERRYMACGAEQFINVDPVWI